MRREFTHILIHEIFVEHLLWACEMKIFPAISVDKKFHNPQWFLASKCECMCPVLSHFSPSNSSRFLHWQAGSLPLAPHGKPGKMLMRRPQTVIQQMLQPSTLIADELGQCRSKVNKETGLASDSWGIHERNEFSEPRDLHLPIHRMLNSLTSSLVVQTACSLCCKLIYSLTSPPASLEQFSQSYWDAVSWAQSPKHSHQIK